MPDCVYEIEKYNEIRPPSPWGEGMGVGLARQRAICQKCPVDFDPIKNISTNLWIIGSPAIGVAWAGPTYRSVLIPLLQCERG